MYQLTKAAAWFYAAYWRWEEKIHTRKIDEEEEQDEEGQRCVTGKPAEQGKDGNDYLRYTDAYRY